MAGACSAESSSPSSAPPYRGLKAVVLSLNDLPEVRGLFAWVSVKSVGLSCQAGGAGNTKGVREVIVFEG